MNVRRLYATASAHRRDIAAAMRACVAPQAYAIPFAIPLPRAPRQVRSANLLACASARYRDYSPVAMPDAQAFCFDTQGARA